MIGKGVFYSSHCNRQQHELIKDEQTTKKLQKESLILLMVIATKKGADVAKGSEKQHFVFTMVINLKKTGKTATTNSENRHSIALMSIDVDKSGKTIKRMENKAIENDRKPSI
jgi:hypothetical protein